MRILESRVSIRPKMPSSQTPAQYPDSPLKFHCTIFTLRSIPECKTNANYLPRSLTTSSPTTSKHLANLPTHDPTIVLPMPPPRLSHTLNRSTNPHPIQTIPRITNHQLRLQRHAMDPVRMQTLADQLRLVHEPG